MKTLRFENLIDTNTGKTVEIEVPDDIEHNEAASQRATEFAGRIRQVEDFNEVAELGRSAGEKLFKAFNNKG